MVLVYKLEMLAVLAKCGHVSVFHSFLFGREDSRVLTPVSRTFAVILKLQQ